jgi:hypothetical protein
MWKVKTFGRDCMGNITGYVVERYHGRHREIADTFVGDIYVPGSFEDAEDRATRLCAELNEALGLDQ